jgi:hypothetical protein
MSVGNLMKNVVTVAAADNAATLVGFPSSGNVSVQVTGTLSATITFEATCDGTNWVAAAMVPVGQPPAYATAGTTATAAGIWSASTNAYTGFRARCSAYTSGSPVVTLKYSGV